MARHSPFKQENVNKGTKQIRNCTKNTSLNIAIVLVCNEHALYWMANNIAATNIISLIEMISDRNIICQMLINRVWSLAIQSGHKTWPRICHIMRIQMFHFEWDFEEAVRLYTIIMSHFTPSLFNRFTALSNHQFTFLPIFSFTFFAPKRIRRTHFDHHNS